MSQLAIKAKFYLDHVYCLNGYVAEFAFAKPRRFRFDFAWPESKIALEVDGGIFKGGRHTRATGFHNDCDKINIAGSLGWRVFKATTLHIENDPDSVFLLLKKALAG